MDPQTTDLPQVQNQPVEPASNADNQKKQIISTVNGSKNVLVTVGSNPTVDQLSSALGLTLVLGKLGKHATAVFSGKIPPAIEFLDPEKTFEDTVDSLRDFIIALDKEKADKLRYKVEDDVVKIFITPYKTILTEKDLQFSQGDFNVDVVIALGATQSEELDKSITAHGRILHDATVITINSGLVKSNLGSIDWTDDQASSVSEMLVNLCDAFNADLLDEQISTTFLTGIVAETNRFSNEKTTPKVMTMSAKLMAAGANQQLIATNLRQEGMLSESVRSKSTVQPHDDGGEMVLEHESDSKKSDAKSEDNSTQSLEKTKDTPKKAKISKKSNQKVDTVNPEVTLPSLQPETEGTATNSTKDESPEKGEPAPMESPVPPQAEAPVEPKKDELPIVSQPVAIEPPVLDSLPPLPTPEPISSVTPVLSTDEFPSITPPPSRDAINKPQFGGTLNATTLGDTSDTDPVADAEQSVEPQILEHQNDGVVPATNEEAVESARKALEEIPDAIKPPVSMGSLPAVDDALLTKSAPVPAVSPENQAPEALPPLPEPSPIDAFMQPHDTTSVPPQAFAPPVPTVAMGQNSFAPPSDVEGDGSLPPLPPLPDMNNGSMPPLPPLPGSQAPDPTAALQPQVVPEFMQNMPQSQNSWTQAGQDLAANQADSEAQRQAKIDERVADYKKTVDRNRELNGLTPLNNPSGSGLPPVPPIQPL